MMDDCSHLCFFWHKHLLEIHMDIDGPDEIEDIIDAIRIMLTTAKDQLDANPRQSSVERIH